jgi:hypothetical protein
MTQVGCLRACSGVVDGQDGDVAFTGCAGEDFTGGDHAFLVCQADGLAGQDRGVRCFQPSDADDGRDHKIGFRQRGAGNGARGSVDNLDAGDAGLFELGGKPGSQLFRGQRDELWPPAKGLLKGFVDVASGGQ